MTTEAKSGVMHRRALLAAAGSLAMPAIARGQAAGRRWRCVTSWARNMPGPGQSAKRLADSITSMSQGELTIDVFAAGELLPALQVFDAVSVGTVELAHTAALFWGGKMPAAPLFTTAPFGLAPDEHIGWLAVAGQALWDELYAPFGVRSFVAGNTGPSAAGWFRRDIRAAADLKGLRIRATGLGGSVYTALGATALAIPPSDTYSALERGVVDAVELLAPANDLSAGLHRIARHLMFPGFNKPNGPSELLINDALWRALPRHLQTLVETACQAEHSLALAETHRANAAALEQIVAAGVTVQWLPDDVMTAARTAAQAVLDRVAASGPIAERIVSSQRHYMASTGAWRSMLHQGRAPHIP